MGEMKTCSKTNKFLMVAAFAILFIVACNYLLFNSNTDEEGEKFVREFTRLEQERLRIDCGALRPTLAKFLEEKIKPVIKNRKGKVELNQSDDKEFHSQLDGMFGYLANCARLYEIGKDGTLNGLQSIAFSSKSMNDLSTLTTLLKENPRISELCNEKCLDTKINLLEESYDRLISATK